MLLGRFDEACVRLEANRVRTFARESGPGVGVFWDALVIEAAQASGAETLYSEDLSDGQQYGGLQVVNPLVDATPT